MTLTTVRPAKAASHADEAIHAVMLGRDGETDAAAVAASSPTRACRRPTTPRAASATRASSSTSPTTTTYARRAAGEVACGTTLDLGRLRLDCAFFTWRMEGRSGVGRYDVLRRVDEAARRAR